MAPQHSLGNNVGVLYRAAVPATFKSLQEQAVNLTFLGIISLPAFTSAAGLLKSAFRLLSMGYALVLLRSGRLTQYITFCIWLFLLTPGIRRVVDLETGWSAIKLLML